MTTEQFTKAQFEITLKKMLRRTVDTTGIESTLTSGIVKGEWEYNIHLANTNKKLVVRSSVQARTGVAAKTSDNSIRVWVMYYHKGAWRPLMKLGRWITRVKGWECRLSEKLHTLYVAALRDSRMAIKTDPDWKPKAAPRPASVTGHLHKAPAGTMKTAKILAAASAVKTPFSIELGAAQVAPRVKLDSIAAKAKSANAAQLTAIETDPEAAVRVMAGPGSGKTYCIERRYKFLIESGISPLDIYAVTFNKSMASELLARILLLVPEIEGTDAEKQICTIHALNNRILKAEGDRRRVAKAWQCKKIIEAESERMWRIVEKRPAWKDILAWIDASKRQGLKEDEDSQFYLERLGPEYGPALDILRVRLDQKLKRQNLMTFTDMLTDVDIGLREDNDFRARWQRRVKYLIVDEGQDTSNQAMRVLATLAAPQNNVFLVGDIDQMMYRFAGASPEANLLGGFEDRYPDGKLVLLGENYRSTKEIVETQLELIRNNYGAGQASTEYLKPLQAREGAEQGEKVSFAMFDDATAEAEALAGSILEEMANGQKPGEIFIGARTRAQLGHLEGPLIKAQIPFINITGGSFWSLKHVAGVIGYIRLATDKGDSEAFKRVFNVASGNMRTPWRNSLEYGQYCNHRFLGKAFLAACKNNYREVEHQIKSFDADGDWEMRSSFYPGAEDLVQLVKEIQIAMAGARNIGEAVEFIIDNCYRQVLLSQGGAEDGIDCARMDDLATLIELASKFATAEEFLADVAEGEKQAAAVKDKDWSEYVVLSTVHRLKGLERKVVFGVGLAESAPGEKKYKGLLPHTFATVEPPQNGVLPTGARNRMEDERCIAFVLVSRAKQIVRLSAPGKYQGTMMTPSRFVYEMGLITER